MSRIKRFEEIRAWANERGLYDWGDPKTQLVKLGEEYGELCRSVIKQDKELAKDSLGDMVVVLVNAAHLMGFRLEECVDAAYEEIKNRKGSMTNGSFVKIEEHVVVEETVINYAQECIACGMEFSGTTGYVCNVPKCPMNLNSATS